MGNGAAQRILLKARFVIFRCQKYVKKGYIEMTKKIYLEPLKGCAGLLHFPLLGGTRLQEETKTPLLLLLFCKLYICKALSKNIEKNLLYNK